MDPSLEMACFTSSTLPGVNLKLGEMDDLVGNSSFSRVSFLAWIYNKDGRKKIKEKKKKQYMRWTDHLV